MDLGRVPIAFPQSLRRLSHRIRRILFVEQVSRVVSMTEGRAEPSADWTRQDVLCPSVQEEQREIGARIPSGEGVAFGTHDIMLTWHTTASRFRWCPVLPYLPLLVRSTIIRLHFLRRPEDSLPTSLAQVRLECESHLVDRSDNRNLILRHWHRPHVHECPQLPPRRLPRSASVRPRQQRLSALDARWGVPLVRWYHVHEDWRRLGIVPAWLCLARHDPDPVRAVQIRTAAAQTQQDGVAR